VAVQKSALRTRSKNDAALSISSMPELVALFLHGTGPERLRELDVDQTTAQMPPFN
jgi:hypothetical protein